MSNWFDSYAKRAARSEGSASTSEGITRRQALIGGAVATGVMWTAPALLSATPAWAAISCEGNAPRCGSGTITPPLDGTTGGCCPPPVNGFPYTCPTETNTCTSPGTLGGVCTNQGGGGSGCVGSVQCGNIKNQTGGICGGVNAPCATNSGTGFAPDCASSAPYCAPKGTGGRLVCSTSP